MIWRTFAGRFTAEHTWKSVGAIDRTLGYATTTWYDICTAFTPPPRNLMCRKTFEPFYLQSPFEWITSSYFSKQCSFLSMLGGWVPTGGRRISRGGWRVLPKAQRTAEWGCDERSQCVQQAETMTEPNTCCFISSGTSGWTEHFHQHYPPSPHFFLSCFTDSHPLQR